MPVLETKGALSAQGYGLTTSQPQRVYIEDTFSTWLYTGTGSAQTITNGIDLAPGATSPGWFSLVSFNANSAGYGNAVDASGNVYISTNASMQVLKYNSSGQLIWQRGLSGGDSNITRIALDSSANVYVTGSTFSGGWRIVKYDTNGTLLWQRAYTSSLSFDVAYSIATDSTNSVYVCGGADIGAGGGLTLIKYDTNGTLQWQRALKNFTTDGLGVAIDLGDNPLVCGSANGLAVVAKYNSSGTLQWQRTINGGRFNAVTFDASSNVYVAGSNNVAAFIAKYNSSGTIQWQRSLTNPSSSGASFSSIAVDSSGNPFVCGVTGSPQNGILLARYDTNGTFQWQRSILSATSSYTSGSSWSIKVDSSSNIYFSANFQTQFFTVDLFFGKIPADGTGIGTYALGSGSFSYSPSSFTPATSTNTAATGTLTGSTPSFTSSTTSLTNATSTLASSLAALNQVSSNGLVWLKGRSGATNNALFDTVRGAPSELCSNNTAIPASGGLSSFLANGFSLNSQVITNGSGATYVSWTFRKQPKFFDVVTYTGNGANRTIAHALGSVPGCIMVKRTDTTGDWQVYHRSLANTQYLVLNTDAAAATGATRWNSTTPTSTVFSLGTDATVNANGGTYVAYIFAHNAGGFGATGTDNVISCGSYAGTGSTNSITLGYEPQWVLIKGASGDGAAGNSWILIDNMRGFPGVTDVEARRLFPNAASAEAGALTSRVTPTGFQVSGVGDVNDPTTTYIYIAIRRGPMRTPTSGTSVFGLSARTGTGANATVTGGQTDDAVLIKNRGSAVASLFSSRLTGTGYLVTSSTAAEVAAGTTILQANPWDVMDGIKVGTTSTITNASANTFINYLFRRAPGFFDVVCYTGTGVARTVSHNLGVAPELLIVKKRNNAGDKFWIVYAAPLGSGARLELQSSAGSAATGMFDNTTPTSTVFSVAGDSSVNGSSDTFVAYLFASAPGVSKVGSYTGTGATQTINCGFAAGARFVLIKRTDSTGDWYVWDSARGIVAGNDPYLALNSTAAEVINTDWVDTAASGFELSNAGGNLVNTNGASYIFLSVS